MTEQTQKTTSYNIEEIWQKILENVRGELSEQSYKTWFNSINCKLIDGNTLTLEIPDQFYGEWLKEHYENIIQSATQEVIGFRPVISYDIVEHKTNAISALSYKTDAPVLKNRSAEIGLNEKYNFDNFVIGAGNRFAHAASLAVSEQPAKQYNPLFIYGRVGLGKTHLLQAIAHFLLSKNKNCKVAYVTSEKFTNQLITAIQTRSTANFREKYRTADLLLIDDIHFIAGKESTQEEFFHTFNTLYDAHKQIVVTSDRPPKDIPGLEERLVSRFEWGLVADIQPPDLETRVAILRKLVEKQKEPIHDDVLFLIADKIRSNIRELEGALIRVIAYSSLTGVPVDTSLAQNLLHASFREEENKITIDQIQRCVADYYGLKLSDLRSKRRSQSIVLPRQVAMYLVRELTSHSLPEIGDFFGGRGHATVLHAIGRIKTKTEKDSGLKRSIEQLMFSIKK